MSLTQNQDWNPETYSRFRDLRLRPALDLMAQVPRLPEGDVIDLGCGAGAVGPALAQRFAGRRLLGVDSSPQMLNQAEGLGVYSQLQQADIAEWQPQTPPALIFSNAALNWLPDHAQLLPRLAGLLVAGGVLAVQMPRQYFAPSHRLLREIAAQMFPDRFAPEAAFIPPVQSAVAYWQLLQGWGEVDAWESLYVQQLAAETAADTVADIAVPPAGDTVIPPVARPVAPPAMDTVARPVARPAVDTVASPAADPASDTASDTAALPAPHPVRRFTQSTVMRPILAQMTPTEQAAYVQRYDAALAKAYPLLEDGAVLMPFTRIFITLQVT